MVYVGSCAGYFLAFDTDSGNVVWEYDVSVDAASQFHGNPLIIDSLIYFGTDEGSNGVGTIYCLNRITGDLTWKSEGHWGVASDIAYDGDSLIYLVTSDDSLLVLSARDGHEVWSLYSGWYGRNDEEYGSSIEYPKIVSSPLYSNDFVIFVGRNGKAYCVNSKNGKQNWSLALESIETSGALQYGKEIIIGTSDYKLLIINSENGKVRKSKQLGYLALGDMELSGDLLICLAGNEDNRPKDVMSYNLKADSVEWIASIDSEDPEEYWYVPRIHVWNDQVIVGSTGGMVAAYDVSNGELSWTHEVLGPVRGIGSFKSMLFVGTFNGMLYAFERSY